MECEIISLLRDFNARSFGEEDPFGELLLFRRWEEEEGKKRRIEKENALFKRRFQCLSISSGVDKKFSCETRMSIVYYKRLVLNYLRFYIYARFNFSDRFYLRNNFKIVRFNIIRNAQSQRKNQTEINNDRYCLLFNITQEHKWNFYGWTF